MLSPFLNRLYLIHPIQGTEPQLRIRYRLKGGSRMQLLYEDSHLLVCVKPVGILSQRDASGKPNLEDLLQQHLSASGSCAAVYPVHRLDQAVGGVMVYAKTKHCAALLSQAIQSGGVLKQYLAIIHGVLEPASRLLSRLSIQGRGKKQVLRGKDPAQGR